MSSPVKIWRQHKKLHNYLNKVGRLVVWTKIYVAPAGFEHQVPYLAGIVQFNGERLPLQIVDCEEKDLKPNLKVVTVIRKIGKAKSEDVIEYGVKVKPVQGGSRV
ncbi:OB-fold domain-containing protein [Candidatus Daviesbacteria bacterium]|nr:OB-fold domain-containing protein [Candidatus Daviesbacteria bacterium]